jgi:hypothetical protein
MLTTSKPSCGFQLSPTLKDPLRVHTTASFPALQFNTAKKQLMATRKVPKAVIHQKTELTLNFLSVMEQRSFEYQA